MNKKSISVLSIGAIVFVTSLVIGMLTNSLSSPHLMWILISECVATIGFAYVLAKGNAYTKSSIMSVLTLYVITTIGYALLFRFLNIGTVNYLHIFEILVHGLLLVVIVLIVMNDKKELDRF